MTSSQVQDLGHTDTYWETIAATRWGAYTTSVERRAILKAATLSGKPGTALEIGAEGGRWSSLLTDRGWKMICTDVNEETLAVCRERIPSAECILVAAEDSRIPCESGRLDLLLCIEVPPVMQAEWFVGEVDRVLHDGGLVVGVFWNRWSVRGYLAHLKSVRSDSYDYYKLPYPSWRRSLLASGFSMLHEEGYCWLPFGRSSNSPLIPFLVRMERWLGLRKWAAASPWIVFVARKSA